MYSASAQQYVEYAALSGREAELWQKYQYLVYNAVYDAEGRSQMFIGAE